MLKQVIDVSCLPYGRALSTLDENRNILYNTSMARKLLIAIALIIAAFPYFGFTHTTDTYVTTTLGLFMAAVLLFSKRPKMIPQQKPTVYPESKPSPFALPMHELPVVHPKEEAFSPIIAAPTPSQYAIPSPIEAPAHKRARVAPAILPKVEETPVAAPIDAHPAPVRRVRKPISRMTLSEEDQVQPADVPFSPNTHSFEEPHIEAHS